MSFSTGVQTDVIVIGGGQAGLAVGYYLRRAKLSFVILDDEPGPGGAWQHTWPSLRLFSPAEVSSLPGRQMPPTGAENPDAAHVISYLADYERRYRLPIERPVRVTAIHAEDADTARFRLETSAGEAYAQAVVSATGTWSKPFWPAYPGQREFRGRLLHSARYAGPEPFRGQRVAVVGGANSAAQIAADLAETSEVIWCLDGEPRYLPDDVDGHDLFRVATRRTQALAAGETDDGGVAALGNIVVVPPVKRARDLGRLVPHPLFERLTPEGIAWPDGTERAVDAVIWSTGFRPALAHLRGLQVREDDGRIRLDGTASTKVPGLYFVGYGDWTGPASATLIGVGQTARATAAQIAEQLGAK